MSARAIEPAMPVKCLKVDDWKPEPGPQLGAILTVAKVIRQGHTNSKGAVASQSYLGFNGWPVCYAAKFFRPLDQIDEMQERVRALGAREPAREDAGV